MKTALIVIAIIAVVLVAGGIGWYYWGKGKDITENQPADKEFSEEGILIKDKPGLQPGVLYLVYVGSNGYTLGAQLSFDDNSQCFEGNSQQKCDPNNLQSDGSISVKGSREGTQVKVTELKKLTQQKTRAIKIYYYNQANDKDSSGKVLCSKQGLVAVDKQIPLTITPIQDAINLLLQGQASQGLTANFPLPGVKLSSIGLNAGVLTLNFEDLGKQLKADSCKASVMKAQIEETAKQFPEVTSVLFRPEDLFQATSSSATTTTQ